MYYRSRPICVKTIIFVRVDFPKRVIQNIRECFKIVSKHKFAQTTTIFDDIGQDKL